MAVLYTRTHPSNHTNCYKMHLDMCILVAVQVSLSTQLQGQGILLGHIWCCQSLTKGNGRRPTATPTKGINTARPMQVTGTWHLPRCTFECGEAVIPWCITEGPEKGKYTMKSLCHRPTMGTTMCCVFRIPTCAFCTLGSWWVEWWFIWAHCLISGTLLDPCMQLLANISCSA